MRICKVCDKRFPGRRNEATRFKISQEKKRVYYRQVDTECWRNQLKDTLRVQHKLSATLFTSKSKNRVS